MPVYYDVATRAQVVALRSYGVNASEVASITGIQERTQRKIVQRAEQRGFVKGGVILNIYLDDDPKSGAPRKRTESFKEELAIEVRRDRYSREKSTEQLAIDLSQARGGGEGRSVSHQTIWRELKEQGFRSVKPTKKPGLTPRMRLERYNFAERYKDWTIEQWKDVIWSDETSIVIGVRRGGIRIWRQPSEKVLASCLRARWKGYTEFMFWGCFSYYAKGPCHIYKVESAQQKKDALEAIEKLNQQLEPQKKLEWELQTGVRRLGLRNKPGAQPRWKWDKKHGKLVRDGKGGIDWWRYQSEVLKPKLLPFAKQCMEVRPQTIVQEDKAPSHAHWYQAHIYAEEKIPRLVWCGNSPDLNAIEPAWPWLKRQTTRKGAPESAIAMEKAWLTAWDELEIERVQKWVERIPRHIQKILELHGGNEYVEGRFDKVTHHTAEELRRRLTSEALSLTEQVALGSDFSCTSSSACSTDLDDDIWPLNRHIYGDFRDDMTWSELEEFEADFGSDDDSDASGVTEDAEGVADDET